MSFLEWIITWFFADQLTSRQEEAKELKRLREEVEELRSQIESVKNREKD